MKEVKIERDSSTFNNHLMFNVYSRGDDPYIAGRIYWLNENNGLSAGYGFQAFDTNNYSLSAETMRQITAKIDLANEAVKQGLL